MVWNDLLDMMGSHISNTIPVAWNIQIRMSIQWTPIYQSSMTGLAVATVTIAMTILHEIEVKTDDDFLD